MKLLPLFALVAVGLLIFAAMRLPKSAGKSGRRRLAAIKARGAGAIETAVQARRIAAQRQSQLDQSLGRLLPSPERLRRRLEMTGKPWTLGHYVIANAALAAAVVLLLFLRGFAPVTAVAVGVAVGVGLPWMVVVRLGRRRVMRFITRLPDAIELLVRGLRSGLPISETIGVVAAEVPDPVGTEFRGVTDKMKIGRSMEGALQDTADRLNTPEFQFFVISLAIQRETGGNLAETLANLADVLRKRMQMKLKVRAMSSESKASAYIIGSLPFIVFGLIYYINPEYMGEFFTDQRLIYVAMGSGVWMAIGAFIMAKMISFEI